MITALIILIVILYIYAVPVLVRDLKTHWAEMRQEPGRPLLQAINATLIYFVSALGISDFAICTALYHKTGWSEPRKLPGTLNTQCAIPAFVCGISYLLGVKVDLTTLLPCLVAFVLGAFLSPRLAVRLPVRRIRQILVAGLLFAGTFMLANKLQLLQISGQAMGLSGVKLFIAPLCFFVIGVLKALGIGSYPLTMATAYFLGLHPLVAYPLMMGGGALAAPLVLVRYIRMDAYMRRLTLMAATFGLASASVSVFVVKSLNISALQWLVVVVVFYAATDMLLRLRRESRQAKTSTVRL